MRTVILIAGLLSIAPVMAQDAPALWRDPDGGCTYLKLGDTLSLRDQPDARLQTQTVAAPVGKQVQTVTFNGQAFTTHTYRPEGEIKGVMLAFHGIGRAAKSMLDGAIKFATANGYYVVAPVFDTEQFSGREAYQFGGLIDDGSFVTDPNDWSVSRAKDFALWAAKRVGLDPVASDTVLFGHSAGAQYLSRVAAFAQDDSLFDKIVVGNPSTLVWPDVSTTWKVPHGFGGTYFSTVQSKAMLKDYLADPISIYIGSEDDNPHASDLAKGRTAMRQGANRLERGINAYNAGKAMAASQGWDFNWELVIANGVGHTSTGLLNSPSSYEAFDGRVGGLPRYETGEQLALQQPDSGRLRRCP
jgi:predicted esterase